MDELVHTGFDPRLVNMPRLAPLLRGSHNKLATLWKAVNIQRSLVLSYSNDAKSHECRVDCGLNAETQPNPTTT